jgi:hypothetical protein
MAGFKPPVRTASIIFDEDSDYFGAEVEMRLNIPMGVVFELQLADTGTTNQRELLQRIGDMALISWNVEDENDNAVPADGAGLLAQPPDFIWAILGGWQEAMTKPNAPLSLPSRNGSSSEEPSMKEQGVL